MQCTDRKIAQNRVQLVFTFFIRYQASRGSTAKQQLCRKGLDQVQKFPSGFAILHERVTCLYSAPPLAHCHGHFLEV